MRKTRDVTIDIMKGILILLMVSCHAQGPGHRFFYLFHMACFFMISGYLYQNRNEIKLVPYIINKVRTLYIPYVICNIAYLTCFLFMPMVFEKEMCQRTVLGIVYEVIKIFFFCGRCSLSDPTCFLAVLFAVSIIYAVVNRITINFVSDSRIRYAIINFSAIVAMAFGYIFYLLDFNWLQVGTICSSYTAFHMGNVIKKFSEEKIIQKSKIEKNFGMLSGIAAFVGVGGLLLLYNISDVEIRLITNTIVNPIYYLLGMLFGWMFLRCISIVIEKKSRLRYLFSYLGRSSLIILCVHLAAFKVVAMIQCVWFDLPLSNISAFPVVRIEGLWWCAYTAAGICLPLLIRYLYYNAKESFLYNLNRSRD